jgi:hypothetical protein
MATRELKMRWEPVACEICRRNLLRGESPVTFYDGQSAYAVCDLCTTRAHRLGWLREGTQLAENAPAAHAERARSLVARLRVRRAGEASSEQPEPEQVVDDIPHHVQALPSAADAQVARALGLFNVSQHARTIAGVLHSLGAPYVQARAGGRDPLVEITVVWELCWYRFEVDLENEVVRQGAQGYDPAELGGELPPANVTADDAGKLSPAVAEPARSLG